ncbi:hypothetical protein CCL13_24155 [Pseudomonas syringae]|nr:hypothetical protein CCL13_24155 [Pseudomonas syringae]
MGAALANLVSALQDCGDDRYTQAHKDWELERSFILVDSIGTHNNPVINTAKAVASPATSPSPRAPSATSNKAQDSGKLSSLSVQLSESATRAASRDASLDHDALGAKAAEKLDQIIGRSYDVNKAKNDAEVPDTTDPELLAHAKKATQFVNGGRENPLAGMARDQSLFGDSASATDAPATE